MIFTKLEWFEDADRALRIETEWVQSTMKERLEDVHFRRHGQNI